MKAIVKNPDGTTLTKVFHGNSSYENVIIDYVSRDMPDGQYALRYGSISVNFRVETGSEFSPNKAAIWGLTFSEVTGRRGNGWAAHPPATTGAGKETRE